MTNVMEDMEDYVEYNDTIKPENDTANIFIGLLGVVILVMGFFFGRYTGKLPTILIHMTRDDKLVSLYVNGHSLVQAPNEKEWTWEFHYDLNQEKND